MATITNVPKDTALRVRVGSTLVLKGEVQTGGVPVDLTGATLPGKIGTTNLTATVTDALAGKWELEIPPAAVPTVTSTTWYLDMVDTLGRITPLLRGPAEVV